MHLTLPVTIILLFISLLTTPASANEQKALLLVIEFGDHLPYVGLTKDRKTYGLYVDMVKASAEIAGRKVKIRPFPLKRCQLMVDRGYADGMVGAFMSKENQERMVFAKEPLAFEEISLFTYQKSHIVYNGTLESIYPYVIGCVRGAVYYDEWEENKTKIRRLEYSNKLANLIQKLSLKRVDAIIGNKLMVQFQLSRLNLENNVVDLYPSLALHAGHLAFSRSDDVDGPGLADTFNKAIFQLKSSDKFSDILNKYVNF